MTNKQIALSWVVSAVSMMAVILGCDGQTSATHKPSGNSSQGGNSAGSTAAHTDGASAEGADVKGIMLVHEGTVAFEKGDLTTAKAKLEEADKIKGNLSPSIQETIEELRNKIAIPATVPAQ